HPALDTLSLHDALPIWPGPAWSSGRSDASGGSPDPHASAGFQVKALTRFHVERVVPRVHVADRRNSEALRRVIARCLLCQGVLPDRKSTRLNSSHLGIS